ncbi:hypothetical protein NHX12_010843 [Muraenolepis orangiensis]|uniref:Uncharacterized protein n=1 Tax=Muraenolepis orangiensis TaxID=630683 RepID=A0A9Q0I6L3_9TELE|nr:hypothetical protein NHX12_010843 [Muraenolepis orangiensis]
MLVSVVPLMTLVLSRLPAGCLSINKDHMLDSDRWLSGVSEKDGYWDKFRDEDYFRSWPPTRSLDQERERRPHRHQPPGAEDPGSPATSPPDGPDATKDPCLRVRCSPHKVCVSRDLLTAVCTRRKQPTHSIKARKGSIGSRHRLAAGAHGKCRLCPGSRSSSVCGSDGHTYSSKCKLEFHGCLSGKVISVKCDGPCPCLPGQEASKPTHRTTQAVCSDRDLRSLGSRLKVWFGVLHLDANRDLKASDSSDSAPGRFDTSILPICKDSLGWMFNKLDVNFDLLLDQSELSTLYLDKYELCMKPLFNSCDSFKDGKLSNNEWNALPEPEEQGSAAGSTEEYQGTGQCWCVDKYGNEIAGSRKQGNPSCDEDQEASGDFGSGGAVLLLNDQEEEPSVSGRGRQKEGRGRIRHRRAIEDDEDEGEEKDDEMGYIW